MVWRARGWIVFLANRPVGVPSCPSVPARGISEFWNRQFKFPDIVWMKRACRDKFPDMLCMKKVYKDK